MVYGKQIKSECFSSPAIVTIALKLVSNMHKNQYIKGHQEDYLKPWTAKMNQFARAQAKLCTYLDFNILSPKDKWAVGIRVA